MQKNEPEMNDELRPEYDLTQLRVRRVGPKRTGFGSFVRLAPDVEQVFPNSESRQRSTALLDPHYAAKTSCFQYQTTLFHNLIQPSGRDRLVITKSILPGRIDQPEVS